VTRREKTIRVGENNHHKGNTKPLMI